MADYSRHDAARHDKKSVDAPISGTGSESAEAISFADVVHMTHEQASEPGPLIQALHASPERTRNV